VHTLDLVQNVVHVSFKKSFKDFFFTQQF